MSIKYIRIIAFLAVIWSVGCADRYNVVRKRDDKYLQSTMYSLATEHELDGPGDIISNYGKGRRKLRVDYSREIKSGKLLKDEMRLDVQLFDDDPDVDKKMILLVDDQPFQVQNANFQHGNKSISGTSTSTHHGTYMDGTGKMHTGSYLLTSSYSVEYKTAKLTLVPPASLTKALKKVSALSVRFYMGAEVATAVFDIEEIEAVRKFYNSQVDELVTD